MKRTPEQTFTAIGNILNPEGLDSIQGRYTDYKSFFNLAQNLMNMAVDYSPLENGCIMKSNATYPMYILSGRTISGQC